MEKKKTELAQKARKEIADYIAAGKVGSSSSVSFMKWFVIQMVGTDMIDTGANDTVPIDMINAGTNDIDTIMINTGANDVDTYCYD